ncbi:MAG: DUF6265 family protein [Myxococcota bacterium]
MQRFLCVLFALGCGSAAPPIANPDLEDIQWLAGDWVDCDGERQTWERWRPLHGGMVGRGTLESAGEIMREEDLHIDRRGEGFVYVATLENGSTTEFPLVRASSEELVFENPTHSHPQRIRYRLNDEGQLRATIEQLDGSQRTRWRFRRDSCE